MQGIEKYENKYVCKPFNIDEQIKRQFTIQIHE